MSVCFCCSTVGITDFGLDQINSNGSDDSIFSITQDDLFFDEDEDGEIERLSEFDAVSRSILYASICCF